MNAYRNYSRVSSRVTGMKGIGRQGGRVSRGPGQRGGKNDFCESVRRRCPAVQATLGGAIGMLRRRGSRTRRSSAGNRQISSIIIAEKPKFPIVTPSQSSLTAEPSIDVSAGGRRLIPVMNHVATRPAGKASLLPRIRVEHYEFFFQSARLEPL